MRFGVSWFAEREQGKTINETVLLLIPLAFSALVYFPITRNYFFADDFLHLYRIRNENLLSYILVPRGGHLLVTNNTLFYFLYRLFGTHAESYYWVALVAHLLNVALLFWVIRGFTESGRLACFGATLWGISPMNEATLGWFSVFGQVLVATIMLCLLVRLARVSAGRPLHPHTPVLWCLSLLAACTSFGIGLGLTLVFPIVAFLLLPVSPTRTRVVLIFCVLAALVPALYFGLTRLATMLYMPRTAPLFIETNLMTNLVMFAHVVGYGIVTLVMGRFVPSLEYPSPAAYVVIALVSTAVAAVLFLAPGKVKRRLLVSLILCLGCYGMIVLGRAAFFANAGRPYALIRAGRYQYAAPIPLAIGLCVVLAYADKLYPLRSEMKTGFLACWVFSAGVAFVQFGKPIDHHIQARRETATVVSAIRAAIESAGPGQNVYIPQRPFRSLGAIFAKRQDIFPGWAGVFVIFYPDNVVDGKPVFFVTSNPKLLSAAQKGRRTANLLVAPGLPS